MSKDFKLTLIDYGNARRIKSPEGQLVDAVGVTEFTGGYRCAVFKSGKRATKVELNYNDLFSLNCRRL